MSATESLLAQIERWRKMTGAEIRDEQVEAFDQRMEQILEDGFEAETALILALPPVEAAREILDRLELWATFADPPFWATKYASYLRRRRQAPPTPRRRSSSKRPSVKKLK